MTLLFDVDRIHRHRQYAATYATDHDFLIQAIELELANRIESFNKNIAHTLINGARTDHFDHLHLLQSTRHINAYNHLCKNDDYVHLSSVQRKFDLIVDCLKIHTINDVERYLTIIKDHLHSRGIFIAAFYGGESLRELRQSLLNTELQLYQGAALRIIPMIDMNSTVQLLQHTGFQNIIVDHEILTITYPNLYKILNDIKHMGESKPFVDPPHPLRYQHFKATERFYVSNYSCDDLNLKATVEIIYIKCEI